MRGASTRVAAQSRRLQPFPLHGEQIGAAAGQQLEHGLGVFLRLAGLRRLVLEAGDGVVNLAQLALDGSERIESGMNARVVHREPARCGFLTPA